MRTIEREAARFVNTRVYVHHRSKKEGAEVDGRYLRIGGIFRLGAPNLKHRQFIGIHTHLIITMNYPDYIKDMLGIAADLPGISRKGNVTWVHTASCSVHSRGLWYFIPRYVWDYVPGDYEKHIKTTTTVSIISGIGGGHYHILNVPLLTRAYLRNRYKDKPYGDKNADKTTL